MTEIDSDIIQYTFIDKSSWPSGTWHTEPDRIIWTDSNTGLPYIINRHSQGFWLGYVGIPNGHKLHGIHADDVSLDAHQGIEFSGVPLANEVDKRGLDHLHDWYWFGFSCSYWDDYIPGHPGYREMLDSKPEAVSDYKDVEYVKNECRKLASQLAAIG